MWNFKKVREMEYNEKKIKETQGKYILYTKSCMKLYSNWLYNRDNFLPQIGHLYKSDPLR